MNRQIRHRVLAATALAALLAGGAASAATPQHRDDRQARKEHRQDQRQEKRDDHREAAQVRRDVRQEAAQVRRDDRREAVQAVRDDRREALQARREVVQPQRMSLQDGRKALQQRAVVQAHRDDRREAVQDRRDDRHDWRQDQRRDRQDARQDRRDDRHDQRQDRRDDRHDRRDDRRDAQHRIAYARYRQDYDRRARDYRVRIAPRYYIRPAHYRYFWGGTWYTTSNYGADVLRQAVDWGYREGMRAGRADRYDGWPADYRDSIAWMQGGFGYGGRYISRAEYQYYFRQGFQRGYDDGYFGRMQYGRYVNNDAVIAEAVIATILGLQLLR
ncbi:MAG TPA: hypothetical protein VFT52_08070 [Luteimonas sp.]|nr:hypothetical protein [Luteimonas sp.]